VSIYQVILTNAKAYQRDLPFLVHVTEEQHKNERFFHLLFVVLSMQQAEKRLKTFSGTFVDAV
jgi:hypothetical protein